MLQPSAPASTAARLIEREPGNERRPARLGNRVLERARDQREVAAVQAVARARPGSPTAGRRRPAARSCRAARAPSRSRSRDRDERRPPSGPAGTGSRTHVRRAGTPHEHEAAADGRRDVVGVRRSGAEPLAFERAGDEHVGRAARAEQRVDRHDRRGGARRAAAEAARQRQSLADASATRRAARRAPVSSASAATPAVLRAASRGSRPPSPSMSSIGTPADAKRAVTSSPGASSAKPSTSKPQPTFDTVAGAKAVTDVIGGSSG